jgi:hypothetical protein
MERRPFLASSIGAALSPALSPAFAGAAAAAPGDGSGARPRVLEWRRYGLRFGPMEARLAEHVKGALVPALNRAGIAPVGAFSVLLGSESPSLHLLLPHPNAESVATLADRLADDAEYRKAAAAFEALGPADPPYLRVDSWLGLAFAGLPAVIVPSGPAAVPSRVFELRRYDSPSEATGRKKIEMFESAGELAIFRRLDLTPVFFARNLVGPSLPGLSYMLVHADLATRERNWNRFRDDPEWTKLRTTAGFSNAEIMTNLQIQLLRPTDYSQV